VFVNRVLQLDNRLTRFLFEWQMATAPGDRPICLLHFP